MRRPQPKVWELEDSETKRLLSTPDKRTTQGRRDAAVLSLLARTGIRKGELCALTVGNFTAGPPASITVQTLKQRTKGRPRGLPLTADTAALIQDYLRTRTNGASPTPEAPLFLTLGRYGPWKARGLTASAVEGILTRALIKAGITAHVTPHSLRHNFATKALRGGADLRTVQDLLGHRSIGSTQIYLHSHPARLREAVGALGF